MLQWRPTGYCLRTLFADILMGITDEYEAREIAGMSGFPDDLDPAGQRFATVMPPSPPKDEKEAETLELLAIAKDKAEAVELARDCDVAIVFADQWCTEAEDVPTLSLPNGQDEVIAAVAAIAPKTVVVLETGIPVVMPWLDQVNAVLEAWYPGTRGGEAIGRILFGEVSPSGRLPISFPRSVDDLVRPEIPGMIFGPPVEGRTIPTSYPDVQQHKGRFSVEHPEGADVGYRWYDRSGAKPLFPFGFGLTYTRFAHGGLELVGGETVTASFDITNTGERAGIETAQVYARIAGRQRLVGWARVALEPGETQRVSVTAEPRLLASYDVNVPGWRIDGGPVAVWVGTDAETAVLKGEAVLTARTLKP